MKTEDKTYSTWEQGSDFHWVMFKKYPPKIVSPWKDACVFGGCGRDLFRLLLSTGMQSYGWRRLWIPAYFCSDVTCAFLETGIDVSVYPYGPDDESNFLDEIDFLPNDVLLSINYFGISKRIEYPKDLRRFVTIIEDHTHDPWSEWSYNSDSDWCIASLRKTLPLPDGGVLWSPLKHQLPSMISVTNKRKKASLEKIAGMFFKSLYLKDYKIEKNIFRQLLLSSEQNIAWGPISGMTDWSQNLLETFPVDYWREKRRVNHNCVFNELRNLSWLSILSNTDQKNSCPFSVVIIFDSTERRNFVLDELIRSRIYPAILWPLEKTAIEGSYCKYMNLSHRILCIHCDMRYDESDMAHIGKQIRELGGKFNNVQL